MDEFFRRIKFTFISLAIVLTSGSPSTALSVEFCNKSVRNGRLYQFETDVMNSMSAAKRIRLSAQDILAVKSRIHTGGAYASAILKVRTSNGDKALKIFSEGYLVKELASSIVIQEAFAQRGLAPSIHGILSAKEVKELISRHPHTQELIQDSDFSFAVLMDVVEIESHVTEGHVEFIPPQWTPERLSVKITEIEKVFNELQIAIPQDLQLVFDKQGRLLLLDFDTYAYLGKNGRAYGQFSPNGEMSTEEYLKSVIPPSTQRGQFILSGKGSSILRLTNLRKRLGL